MYNKNYLKHFLLSVLLLNSTAIFGQKIYLDKYMNNADKSNAAYVRHYKAINDTLYLFTDHHITGELHQEGTAWVFQDLFNNNILHGPYKTYYKSGTKREEGEYNIGRKLGLCISWYENGNKESEIDFSDTEASKLFPEFRVENFYDSLGNQLVINGEGVFIKFEDKILVDSGRVSKGWKEDEWKGTFNKGKSRYLESYKGGKLIAGVSYDSLDNEYKYSSMTTSPDWENGLQELYKFVAKNLVYPKEARKKRIEGRVYIEFVVDKEGNTTDVKCIRGIHPLCDQVAEEVVDKANYFIPGKLRGQPVKVRMILPITFKLG